MHTILFIFYLLQIMENKAMFNKIFLHFHKYKTLLPVQHSITGIWKTGLEMNNNYECATVV